MCVCITEKERNWDSLWEIASQDSKGEKSRQLPSARWRPKRAGGVIQSKGERRSGEMSLSSRQTKRKKKGWTLSSAFYSTQAFNCLVEAHPRWREWPALLSLLVWMLTSSSTTPRQTRKSCSSWAPHGAVNLTHRINHHKSKRNTGNLPPPILLCLTNLRSLVPGPAITMSGKHPVITCHCTSLLGAQWCHMGSLKWTLVGEFY